MVKYSLQPYCLATGHGYEFFFCVGFCLGVVDDEADGD